MEVLMLSSDTVQWTNYTMPLTLSPSSSSPSAADCCPPPRNVAASVRLPDSTYIFWRCHEEFPEVLELMHVSWQHELPINGLRLTFGEPLAPFASILSSEVTSAEKLIDVLVITISGVAYLVSIKLPSMESNGCTPIISTPIEYQISNELARIQGATTFAATSEYFCIGGQNGHVLCFQLGNEHFAFKDSFELKAVEGGFGTLWGLVSWNKNVGSVKSLLVQKISGKMYLFALYEDGSARIWDLAQRIRLFHQSLCSSPDFSGFYSSSMWLGSGEVPSRVAVLLENTVVTGAGTICVYRWHWAQTDGTFRPNSLMLEHAFPLEQGRVVDVKILADSIWILLETSQGSYVLLKSKLTGGESLYTCQLLELELADQLLQGERDSWDVLFSLHISGGQTQAPVGLSISELFLRRIFQPGCWQIGTFQKLLDGQGPRVGNANLGGLTTDQYRKEVLSMLDLEETSVNSPRNLREWQKFNQEYLVAWEKNNLPYKLFVDEMTGGIGLIRKSSLSLVRELNHTERLIIGRGVSQQAELDNFPVEGEGGSRATLAMKGLLDIMDGVASHLGKLALAAFHETVMRPNENTLHGVIASFVRILDVGYSDTIFLHKSAHVGFDNLREKRKEHHQRERKFGLRMRSGFVELREKAGSWNKVLDLIANFLSSLLPASRSPSLRTSRDGVSYSPLYLNLLAKAAYQIILHYFEAARALLFVLELLINMQGQVGLSANEVARIKLELIPEAQNALIINLILHCLGNIYGEIPQSKDFDQQLSSLQIDGTTTSNGWNRRKTITGFTLMEILVHSFVDAPSFPWTQSDHGFPGPGLLVGIVNEFISWLLMGDGSDSMLNFSRRAVSLFSILLQQGQYRGLQTLSNIMEKHGREQKLMDRGRNADCDWSAHMHILAFCLLAQAHGESSQVSSKYYIQEAIRYFFRAASGLRGANDLLQELFMEDNVKHLQGHGEPAAWRLHYFEWVMQVFEQYNLYEGARQFAHAALDEVDEAIGFPASEELEMESISSVVASLKGRLWANVFKFSVDLGLYADAYSAIICNPDTESQYTCLRRFIFILCERKAYQVLCGNDLPYVGLLERVDRELQWKAESSDIRAQPNLYKILYSFHMHRHNFHHAAGYMYRYVLRLMEKKSRNASSPNIFVIEEQVHSLAAAINVLSLMFPSSAWIGLQYTKEYSPDKPSPMKKSRVAPEDHCESPGIRTSGAKDEAGQLVTTAVLEKDYALAMACLELGRTGIRYPVTGGCAEVKEVVLLLVQAGQYETAFSLLFSFWKDTSLKRELEAVFKILTMKCISQQFQDSFPVSSSGFVASNFKLLPSAATSESSLIEAIDKNMNGNVSVSGKAKSSWLALQSNLGKYKDLHPQLPVVVAETILSFSSEMELPLWLIDMFKGGRHESASGMAGQGADPAALLRIYIEHDRLLDASSLVMDFLRAWASLRPVDIMKRKRMCAVWFPYTLIDRLQARLSDAASSEKEHADHYEKLRHSLLATVQSHLSQIKIDSEDLASCIG